MPLFVAALLSTPVEWRAPSECPTPESARRQLETELEGTAGVERVGVDIEAVGDRFEMTVEVAAQGEPVIRTISLESCSQAVDAAAVVVSLTASVAGEGPEPEPEPVPVPEPALVPVLEAEPLPESEPAPPVETPPSELWVEPSREPPPDRAEPTVPWALEASGGLVVRGLPGVGALVRGGVGFVEETWLVRVSAERWTRRTESVPAPPDAALRASLTSARLEAGGRIPAGPVSIPLTGFVGGGVVVARGVEIPRPRTDVSAVALVGLRAAVVFRVSRRVAVSLGAEGAWVFPRRQFALDGGVTLGSTGGFAGLFTAGVVFGPGAQ